MNAVYLTVGSFSGCKNTNPVSAQKNLFGFLKKFSALRITFPETPESSRTKRFRSIHSNASIPVLSETEFLSLESNEKRQVGQINSIAFIDISENLKIKIENQQLSKMNY
ncbi:MAG: hypothetical protein DI622_14115 [Chryseobacterium sp.]|nr:MAG: hypothetical protein DI622_14115 [Chryseobacterium sp.]